MDDFKTLRDTFEKQFAQTRRRIGITIFVTYAVYGGLIIFGLWVVVKTMQHFGII